jgi:hypothetical protein
MKITNILMITVATLVTMACATQNIVQYEYRSTTMMGERKLIITKDSIVSDYQGRSSANRVVRATTAEEWQAIQTSSEDLNLKKLADLEAPTNNRQTDASPYGVLLISTPDSTYISASFDGYNAHEKLLPLMGQIKKLSAIK